MSRRQELGDIFDAIMKRNIDRMYENLDYQVAFGHPKPPPAGTPRLNPPTGYVHEDGSIEAAWKVVKNDDDETSGT